jgi:hypothetical protein
MKKRGRIMRIVFGVLSTATVVFLTAFAPSCGDDDGAGGDAGSDASTDTDSDTDTDTDADGGADSGTGDPCADGEEVMQPGPDGGGEIETGIEFCADGSWHRYAALECSQNYECTGEVVLCDDCLPSQVCADTYTDADSTICECITPCATDADCAPGEACLCSVELYGVENYSARCLPAGCLTDADCGTLECGLVRDDYFEVTRLECRTESDACHGDIDCGDDYADFCSYSSSTSSWSCDEADTM